MESSNQQIIEEEESEWDATVKFLKRKHLEIHQQLFLTQQRNQDIKDKLTNKEPDNEVPKLAPDYTIWQEKFVVGA